MAIVVLIFLHFQSLKYLLLTLTPLVLAVLWRTGAMVWLGIEFNPANIVTLPLIIGIDVAFGVYIIDRYREEGKLSIFSGSTGKAIIMSSLTSPFWIQLAARFEIQRHVFHRPTDVPRPRHRAGHRDLHPAANFGPLSSRRTER